MTTLTLHAGFADLSLEYDGDGLMQVDWMQGGLSDADGQAEAAEG